MEKIHEEVKIVGVWHSFSWLISPIMAMNGILNEFLLCLEVLAMIRNRFGWIFLH